MVLLRRLSRWCALCDLQILLGGSRSGLSRVFRFMLTMVNQRYGKLVSNVKIWSEYFPAFSQHLRGMGFPFDNGVMFVDDTLKETSRPGGVFQRRLFPSLIRDSHPSLYGLLRCVSSCCVFELVRCHTGDGCVFVNLKDHQVFQDKDRKHGYSYQTVVFPNGVRAVAACLWCVATSIPTEDCYFLAQVWRVAGAPGLGTKVVYLWEALYSSMSVYIRSNTNQ